MSQSMEDLRIPKRDLELPAAQRDALPATKRAALPRNVRSVAACPDPSGHLPKRVSPPPPLKHHLTAPDAPHAPHAGPAGAGAGAGAGWHGLPGAPGAARPERDERKHRLPLHRHHRADAADPEKARAPSPPHVNPHATHRRANAGAPDVAAANANVHANANASSSSVATGRSGHSAGAAGSAAGLRNRLYNVRSDPSLADVPFDIWDDPSASAPFAGRIGGNLAFTSKGFRHPDSHKIRTLRDLLDFPGFRDPLYVRAAAIEGVGTALLSFMISLNQLAAAQFAANSSVLAQATVEAVFTGTTTTMMIYATAAPTGGHLNPFVTMATVCAGLCTVPRGLYYLVAQTVGAIVGNYALKLGVGTDNFFPDGQVGGCTVDFSRSSMGQTYVMETMLYATVAFMSFGVGLDPRQTPIFGPAYSQLLVGLSLTLTVWGSPYVHGGYGGISINPARCLGAQIARYNVSSSWIHWVAALSAGIINGFVYHIMPPATPSLVKKHRKKPST